MTQPDFEKPTILIVDDVPDNLHMLMNTLGEGYNYIPAKNGSAALRKAEKAGRLDLVLLDIMMPEMDGYETLTRLKKNSRLMKVPVIFVTAVSEAMDEAKGFRLGAVDYVTKPFVPDIVRARVATHIELKQKTDLLEKLATTDGLTRIYNRRKIDDIFASEFQRAFRSQNPISVIMIDIDHFKRYNDLYGHGQGDECLKIVASALSEPLNRPSDCIGRYGGEEFLAVLPDTDREGAIWLARKLLKNVSTMHIPHQDSHTANHVTISLGLATTIPGQGGTDAKTFLASADKLLYKAKNEGRNRFCV